MAAEELFVTGIFNDPSIKSYWRLEGNSNDAKASNNGTDTSITYNSGNGKFSQGAGFNGTSSKIAINAARVGANTAYSIVGWFKTTSTGVGTLYGEGKAGTDLQFVYISVNAAGSGDFQFQTRDDGNHLMTMNYNPGAGVLNDGTFHHFVGVKRAANSWEMYIDGVSRGTSSTNLSSASTLDQLSLGVLSRTGDINFYNGALDDVANFTRALTTSEVLMLFQGGVAFNAAANSGDQAAASSYSGSASWYGTSRMLCVDVSMLGPSVTVTSMTYGGANCDLVGAISTVTSFGRVEQWRITSADASAPAAGSNTLIVTLSGSLEFVVTWVSYTGVHQTSPTEAFNSAQATNAGSATNASVSVTTVADRDWVHAAVVANDTSITAGNTTRNNIAGTLGSGANEDNGTAKSPAGSVTMSYSGMGTTTTWAIAGYALRDINAASLASTARFRSLLGVGL